MKSAVELAFYETKNGDNQNNEDGNDGDDSKNTTGSNGPSKPDAAREEDAKMDRQIKEPKEEEHDKRIKELKEELAATKQKHDRRISKIKSKHLEEAKNCESKYHEFVYKLNNSHGKELASLKKDMKKTQNVHKLFLGSYVDASLDVLRNYSDSPSL